MRNLFGDDFFHDVVAADVTRDDQVEKLVAFPYLRKLVFNEMGEGFTTVTDSGLKCLAKLHRLESFDGAVAEEQLSYLKSLTSLRDLRVRSMGNRTMRHLKSWNG